MRQGQQNRRGRGRNNNNNNNNQNRRGQNPLTRSFESTGPDVKIRGTPSHIAEKYLALARDAQSSGDPVLAENYLQHAEHYNRIIMAFREQQIAQGGGDVQNGGMRHSRPGSFGEPGSMGDEFGDEDGDEMSGDLGSMPQPQPSRSHEGQPRHNDGQRFDDRGPRHEGRQQQRERHGGYDRNDRQDRDRGDRGDRGGRQDRGERHERQERFSRPERPERSEGFADRGQPPQPALEQNGEAHQPPPRRERAAAVPHHEQPEFLRRPVRRPRREAGVAAEEGAAPAPTPAVEDTRD
jgi:hypothetical protein